jgi:hypothetical protein
LVCIRGLPFPSWNQEETEKKTGKDCFNAKDEHGGAWDKDALTLVKRKRAESSVYQGKNFTSNENNP